MKKSNALINRCHYFPSKKNSNIDSNTESVKKMFAEISQRMFSEIMPAFTEMTEMFISLKPRLHERFFACDGDAIFFENCRVASAW